MPEAFADPWELNVPELFNGNAVRRISNQAAHKEPVLFVLTGEHAPLSDGQMLDYQFKIPTSEQERASET